MPLQLNIEMNILPAFQVMSETIPQDFRPSKLIRNIKKCGSLFLLKHGIISSGNALTLTCLLPLHVSSYTC